MPTMVDAYGPSACCEVCDEIADESDLEDDGSGREACGHCRGVQAKLSEALNSTKEPKT